jgi:hypothetical protein
MKKDFIKSVKCNKCIHYDNIKKVYTMKCYYCKNFYADLFEKRYENDKKTND